MIVTDTDNTYQNAQKMAKPIFIVIFKKLPWDKAQAEEIKSHFNFLKEDYYVLITFVDGQGDWTPEFKMFSDKELDPIDLKSLQQLIDKNVKEKEETKEG